MSVEISYDGGVLMKEQTHDAVNSPKHYKLRGLDVESVDVIKATLTP